MSFVFPWYFWGLAALIPLVACYFFVGRVKSQQVSTLFLWQQADLVPKAGAKPKKFDRNHLLPLEIVIVLLLVLAATQPLSLTTGTAPVLGVVLDNSFSMQAENNGNTARARALTGLKHYLERHTFRQIFFIEAGTQPRLLDIDVSADNPTLVLEQLRSLWRCSSPSADLAEAGVLARQIGGKDIHVLVLTDHGETQTPPQGTQRAAFGQKARNRGFVNAVRADHPGHSEVLIEVMQGETNQPIEVTWHDGQPHRLRLEASPGSVVAHRFPVRADAEQVVLNLSEDSLAVDNRVVLLRNSPRTLRVALKLDDKKLAPLIQRALAATGSVLVSADKPHLVVFDTEKPIGLPNDPSLWTLQITRPRHTRVYRGPFVVNQSHPLTQGLTLTGTLWAAGTRSMTGRPLIIVGDTVLLGQTPHRHKTHLFLQVDPQSGNLPLSPNWPILFDNLVRWRQHQIPGTATVNIRAGQPIQLRVAPGTHELALIPERGDRQTFPVLEDTLSPPIEAAGVYRVETLPAGGFPPIQIAVNLMQREESDLSSAETGTWGEPPTPSPENRHKADLTPWLLAAALVLSLAHLLLSRRHLGVA